MTGRVALGSVFLVAGVLWLLTSTDIVDLSYQTWIGIILVTIGLAIALTPGGHGLLVLLGVLVALMGIPALVVDGDVFGGGIGDQVEAPVTNAELESYRHGIGKLTVDLTSPDLDLDGAEVEASLGIGDLLVVVPFDTDVTVDAHVGIGNAQVLGEEENGVDVDVDTISGTSGSQEVTLDLEVGIGNLRVEQRG